MKVFTPELQEALNRPASAFVFCWRITRKDGMILGFTEHNRPLTFEGTVFEARTGFTPSAVESDLTLSVDNMEVKGFFDSESITLEDLESGRFDDAFMEILYVDSTNTANRTVRGTGFLGTTQFYGNNYSFEWRSLSQKLQQGLGRVYSGSCDADLGDSKCRAELTPGVHVITGTVLNPNRNNAFAFTPEPGNTTHADATHFSEGFVEFTSGANEGLRYKVAEHEFENNAPILHLTRDAQFPIANGDEFTLTAGCNKTLNHCHFKFGNSVNHQGFPTLPGDVEIGKRVDLDERDQGVEVRVPLDGQEIDPNAPITRTTQLVYGGTNADRIEYNRGVRRSASEISKQTELGLSLSEQRQARQEAVERALNTATSFNAFADMLETMAEQETDPTRRDNFTRSAQQIRDAASDLMESAMRQQTAENQRVQFEARAGLAALASRLQPDQATASMFEADVALNTEMEETLDTQVADLTTVLANDLVAAGRVWTGVGRSLQPHLSGNTYEIVSRELEAATNDVMESNDMVDQAQEAVEAQDAMVQEAITETVTAGIALPTAGLGYSISPRETAVAIANTIEQTSTARSPDQAQAETVAQFGLLAGSGVITSSTGTFTTAGIESAVSSIENAIVDEDEIDALTSGFRVGAAAGVGIGSAAAIGAIAAKAATAATTVAVAAGATAAVASAIPVALAATAGVASAAAGYYAYSFISDIFAERAPVVNPELPSTRGRGTRAGSGRSEPDPDSPTGFSNNGVPTDAAGRVHGGI